MPSIIFLFTTSVSPLKFNLKDKDRDKDKDKEYNIIIPGVISSPREWGFCKFCVNEYLFYCVKRCVVNKGGGISSSIIYKSNNKYKYTYKGYWLDDCWF